MTISVPYSFVPGTKAKAQEVNANFNAITGQIEETNTLKLNKDFSNITQTGLNSIKNIIGMRNLGETIFSPVPLTDANLHLLDGSLISSGGGYTKFVEYIEGLYESANYSNLFTTQSDWDDCVDEYGVCGKFVYNSTNNTVRLPKYSNKLYTNNISSSAPVSGDIADLSDITTPLEGYYYIAISTSTKTDIQIDIDEIATDLNGKADIDLSNITPAQSFKNNSIDWAMPDYTNSLDISSTVSTTSTQDRSYPYPFMLYCWTSSSWISGQGLIFYSGGFTAAIYGYSHNPNYLYLLVPANTNFKVYLDSRGTPDLGYGTFIIPLKGGNQ